MCHECRHAPFSVAPVGRDVPYNLNMQILTQFRHVFTKEDYFLTRQSRSDHVFGHHTHTRGLATGGLNADIHTYHSVTHFINNGAPFPSGFLVIPASLLRNYEGVTAE